MFKETKVTIQTRYPLFASVMARVAESLDNFDHSRLALELGYKSRHLIDTWFSGTALPPQTRLPDLANALGLPLEDFLLPWLADQDPEHVHRFQIITAQMMGLEPAVDLFSGATKNSDRPWWSLRRRSMSAAEVVSTLDDMPPGTFSDA
jgi:hypothetical protein